MIDIHITLSFASNKHGTEQLAQLTSCIATMAPDAFELKVSSSGKAGTSADKPDEEDNRRSKPESSKAKTKSRRPMGRLKRIVFEGLERQQGRFLSMKECGLACGLTALKIKSTVNEAYHKREVERDQVNGVYVYRLASVGLKLLETDRKRGDKTSAEAKEAA